MTLNKPKIFQDIDSINTQLGDMANQIRPYTYTDEGIAFRSDDTTLAIYDNHASWAHGNVAYDEVDDKVIVFYDIKPTHVLTNNRVLMRKKDIEGDFSTPYVVANRITENISCKTQASGICKNGDYISLVAHFDNSSGAVLGTFIYRSVDKGSTWTPTEMKINNQSILAYNGDVTGFLVLENGRILTWACRASDRLVTIMYSDDNGVTWNFATIPTCYYHTEPAWCELSDGTIICFLRETVDGTYNVKTPARFTKSTDGGLTWSLPIVSQSIIDFSNSNGHLIFHKEQKTVEFIHHSRFMQLDGYSSLYVSVASEENAKNDRMGEQIRISRITPQNQSVNGSTGDSGYVGACKSKSGVIHAFYYNGTFANAQICYLLGYKSSINRPQKNIDQTTGDTINTVKFINGLIPTISDYYESGTITLNVGYPDVLMDNTTRVRLKNFVKVKPSTKYSLVTNSTDYNVVVREYDSNFINISDSGWKSNYLFITNPNTVYLKVIIKKVDDSNIMPAEISTNLFEISEFIPTINKFFIYDNGNEKEFYTGLFSEILTSGTGAYAKNSNNLQLSLTNDTGAGIACYIAPSGIDVTGYTTIKANVNVTGISGSSGASVRIYSKNNPTSGADGRLGMTEIKSNGKTTLSLSLSGMSGIIYPAIASSKINDSISGSITAKFYDIWFE